MELEVKSWMIFPINIEVKEPINELLISFNKLLYFLFEIDLELRDEVRNIEIKIKLFKLI